MNNERFTFLKGVRAMALTLFALCAMGASQVSAQICTNNGNVALDGTTCEALVMLGDVAPGANVFFNVSLVTASEHAATPVDPVNMGASVVVSTPGSYKYQVDNANGCWGTFTVEDKSAPICTPAGDIEPALIYCGATVASADPSGVDDLAPEVVSCYVLETYGDAGIEPWFDILDAGDFSDCEKVVAPFFEDFKISSCGDIEAARARLMVLAAANNFTVPEFPAAADYPADFEVCEVRIRVWHATDWQGRSSDKCAQAVVIVRPRTVHLDMRVTTECGAPAATRTTGLDAPYLVDFTNDRAIGIVTCPSHSGMKMKLSTTGEFCKFSATYDDDNVVKTCADKPGCEGLDKTARDWTIWDWCNDALPTIVLHETYMGDPDNMNTMTPFPGQKEFTQIISEEDNVPPTLPMDITPPTVWPNAFDCDVKVQFSNITATDACQGAIVADFQVTVTVAGDHSGTGGSVNKYSAADALAGIDMPRGATWTISASAWDCCGNYTNDNYSGTINAEDNQDPICRADDELEVSLVKTDHTGDPSGHTVGTRITAAAIDEGSYDNCGPVTIKIKDAQNTANAAGGGLLTAGYADFLDYEWTTAEWSEATNMTCEMVIWIELLVTDAAGNTSTCQSAVRIQDNTPLTVVGGCEIIDEFDCTDKIPTDDQIKALYEDSEAPDVWGTCYEIGFGVSRMSAKHCPEDFTLCDRISKSNGNDLVEVIKLTWTVSKKTDAQPEHGSVGPQTVTKYITVSPKDDDKFDFPLDVKVVCAPEGGNTAESTVLADHPQLTIDSIWTNKGCAVWEMYVEDKIFTGANDACYTILRSYEFVNRCKFDEGDLAQENVQVNKDPFDNGRGDGVAGDQKLTGGEFASISTGNDDVDRGYFVYTQIIKVVDNIDPTGVFDKSSGCGVPSYDADGVASQPDVAVPSADAACFDGWVQFVIDPQDGCSGATVGSWSVSFGGTDVTAKFTKSGNNFNGRLLEKGTYTIKALVSDACGNSIWSEASMMVDEHDCKKPTPFAEGFTFTALMENCTVEVWANRPDRSAGADLDFIFKDNCTVDEDIVTSIELLTVEDADGNLVLNEVSETMPTTQSVTITSAGSNVIAIWGMDEAGNTQYVTIGIDAQDNTGLCGGGDDPEGGAGAAAAVAGNITNESNEMIDGVTVDARGTGFNPFASLYDGLFNFSIPMHADVTVTPSKDQGYLNGVSGRDLVLIQRHALGIQELTSAYQLIAGDVTNNGAISGSDLSAISKLILGVTDEFPSVSSWRFVPKAHTFDNVLSPWGFPESLNYSNLEADAQADFIGIKMGDVSGNAKATNLLGDDYESAGKMTIAIDDATIAAGATREIAFTAKDFNDFAGYQFTIQLADGVTFQDVSLGALPNHTKNNFAFNRLDNGIITTNWTNALAVNLEDGAVLFTLTVNASSDINVSEAITVNSTVTSAEAYNNDLERFDINTLFNRASSNFALYQNTPNPFSSETIIGFELPTAGAVSLKVMDVAGRVLTQKNGTYTAGVHQITLNKSELGATGVLYYQLDTDAHTATKKMVILE